MIYLLDTNTCIYIIKRKPSEVHQRFEEMSVGDIGVSVVTVAELEYGATKSRFSEQARTALAQFLLPLAIVDFDRLAATVYGPVRASLEAQGKPIGVHDMLIAAQALSLGLTLVTHNTREFQRVSGLRFEDWVGGISGR